MMGQIINVWGINAYGFFILFRLLTPLGYLNVFDFGMIESNIRNVSYYKSSTKNIREVGFIGLSYFIILGIIISLFIFIFGDQIFSLLGITNLQADDYRTINNLVIFSALIQTPLFLMLYFESILKGYEQFKALRVLEIVTMLACIFLIYLFSLFDNTMERFLYAFYGLLLLKMLSLFLFIFKWYPNIFFIKLPSKKIKNDVFSHSSTLGIGKFISTTLDNFPIVMLSIVFGPAVSGIFDVIMRLPRYIKVIMGSVNTALIPYVSSLNDLDFSKTKEKIVSSATKYQIYFFIPFLVLCLIYSEQILFFWIGDQYINYTNEMQLCFIVPILISLIGASSSSSMSNQKILKKLNYINFLRLAIYFIISFILINFMSLTAFIYANIISYIVSLILQIPIYIKNYDIKLAHLMGPFINCLLLSFVILYLSQYFIIKIYEITLLSIILTLVINLLIIFTILWKFGLSKIEKKFFYEHFFDLKNY